MTHRTISALVAALGAALLLTASAGAVTVSQVVDVSRDGIRLELQLAGSAARCPRKTNVPVPVRAEVAQPHDVGRGLVGTRAGPVPVGECRDVGQSKPGRARGAGGKAVQFTIDRARLRRD